MNDPAGIHESGQTAFHRVADLVAIALTAFVESTASTAKKQLIATSRVHGNFPQISRQTNRAFFY